MISGASTTLTSTGGVAVAHGEIFVSDPGANAIDVFPVSANGDVAPIRRIAGGSTRLAVPTGLVVADDQLFVAQKQGPILMFPIDASGDVAPTRSYPVVDEADHALAVDSGELYVSNVGASIRVYPVVGADVTGPTRIIAGPSTGLIDSAGIVVHNGEIIVTCPTANRILVFPEQADGDVPPLRTIIGPDTELGSPTGLALLHDELYVLSLFLRSVQVLPVASAGDVPPTRTIENAGVLTRPIAVAVF
ncbi:MAG TPA: hypothetical protein VF516_03410 [Kofleriaceae bacterium]